MKEISYSNSEDESVQEMQTESFSSKCLCRKCKQKVLAANEKNHGNEEEGRCPSSDFFMDR